MKLKCDSKTLARALDAVERVVKPRIVTPILGHVLLEAYGDRLRLTTTDLEIGVRTSIAAEVAEEGATTAPVRLVAGVVGELPQGQVTLALKDGRLRISSGRFGSTLHTTDVGKFPPGPQAAEDEPIRLPKDEFLAAVGQVLPAVSTDSQNRAVLTGVLMRIESGSLTLVATDAHRLACRRLEGVEGDSEAVVVPARAMGELGRVFRDESGEIEMRFSPSRNQVFFHCGESEVTSRLLDGEYPRYHEIIPTKAPTVVRLPRAELVRAVRAVGVISESMSTRGVSLHAGDGVLQVFANVLQVGDAEAELEAKVVGEPVQVGFNSHFLLDALNAVSVDRVELRLIGPLAPGVVYGEGSEDYLHVVMAVRLAAPPQPSAGAAA